MKKQTDTTGVPEAGDSADSKKTADAVSDKSQPKEIGGRKGPEPTRYGDWEKNGIISDF